MGAGRLGIISLGGSSEAEVARVQRSAEVGELQSAGLFDEPDVAKKLPFRLICTFLDCAVDSNLDVGVCRLLL